MIRSPRSPLVPWLALGLLSACGGGGGGGGGNGGDDPGAVVDPLASEFRVTPAFGTPSDGRATVTIEVRLVSLLGRTIGGAEVELEISGFGNRWAPLPLTDALGQTAGTLASLAGEKKTLTARVDSGGRVVELGPLTVEFLQIPENTFFVRTRGSDANPGRTPLAAWRTLEHALASVGPGATIHVGAGVYAGPLTVGIDSGADVPLRLAGDRSGCFTGDAGEVAIEGGGAEAALRVLGANNVVLSGLTLRGGRSGLAVEGSTCLRVLDCRLTENDVGLAVAGADDLVVQDCRISANFQDGLRLRDARGSRLENDLVYANGASGLVMLAPAANTTIRFNTFYRNGGSHLVEEEAGGTGAIEENIFAEGGGAGLELLGESGYETSDNLVWGNAERNTGRQDPDGGTIEADPLFADPFGPDGILGGVGAEDDDFRLLAGSAALDAGAELARDVLLGSHEALSSRTSRVDGVLEWSGIDLAAANLGFHYPPAEVPFPSLDHGGGRIAVGVPPDVNPRSWSWDRDLPGAVALELAPAFNAELVFLEQRVTPLERPEEVLAAQVDTGAQGQVLARSWDGRRWSEPIVSPFHAGIPRAELAERRFDVEYDSAGRALLVVAGGDSIPSYRLLVNGRWSTERAVQAGPAGPGHVRWVELVPRGNSREMALITLDDRRDLVATLWDGEAWGAPRVLETDTVFTPGWRPFDAAYEALSGDLLVAWGFNTFIEETRWAELDRSSGTWRTGQHPSTDALGAHFVLAADPTSDRVAAAIGEGDLGVDVGVSVWTGSAESGWTDTAELTLAGGTASRLPDVAWIGNTGIACAVFRRAGHAGSFNVAYLFPTGWRIQPDVVLPGAGRAARVRLASLPDRNQLLGALLDEDGRLFGLRFDGQGFALLNGGQPLAQGLDPSLPGRPFDVAVRRPTPSGPSSQ